MRLRILAGASLLLGGLIGAAFGLAGGYGPESHPDAFDALASSTSPAEDVIPALAVGDTAQQRPVYPFSIVPGGVASVDELKQAIATDSVVRAHFANFDLTKTRVETLKTPQLAHVSYRIGPDVFWTKRPLLLKAGERVLTDGKHVARTRCANQLASQPLVLSPLEPLPATLDTPVVGLRADGSEPPRNLPPGISIVPGPPAATTGGTPGPTHGPGFIPTGTGISAPSAGPSSGGVVTPGPGLIPGGSSGPNTGGPTTLNGPSGPSGNPGNPGNPSGPEGPPSGPPNGPGGPNTPPGPPGGPITPPGTPGNPNDPFFPPNTPFGPPGNPTAPDDPLLPPGPPGPPGNPFLPPGGPGAPETPNGPPTNPGTPPGGDPAPGDPQTPTAVPEPATVLLTGLGLAAALRRARRRTING